MPFDVARIRAGCAAVERLAYLNAGTFGPLPRAAEEAMRAHVADAFERGRIGREPTRRWLAVTAQARAGFAQLLSADPSEIALAHCTSDGVNTVVWGLDLAAGDEVVTTSAEHPGLTAPLAELARVRGVVVRVVAPTLEAIGGSIGERTRLVAFSHVLYTTGETLPARAIAEAARERSGGRAFVLVDGAQSVGAFDVAPAALGVDAYTVSGQKWLAGPSGTGALWAHAAARARLYTPWPTYLSEDHALAEAAPWPSARRLDSSTISTTALEGLVASLAWHRAAREDGAHAYARGLVARAREALSARRGVRLVEVEAPSNLVSFTVDGVEARELVARAEERGVIVRSIPGLGYVRASIGFWNDEGDVERLVAALG